MDALNGLLATSEIDTAPIRDDEKNPFAQYDLSYLKSLFDGSATMLQRAREDAERSRDYYDGPAQITPAMQRALRKRKQPEIWINRIRGAVDGIIGIIDSNHVDPRAFPREPGDDDASDVASDTLRYTADQSHFNVTKADVLENYLIEGCGAAIVEVGDDMDVLITQVPYFEFWYDAHSKRPDFKDARQLGVGKWMYAQNLAKLYPEISETLGDFITTGDASSWNGGSAADQTWQDRPIWDASWIDKTGRRLMVCEAYHLEKEGWLRSVWCAAGILEQGISAYKNDRGIPSCAIVAGSCYVSRENVRYGVVRDWRPIQDEINMRRQKMLHMINVRQVQQKDPTAPPVSVDVVREEAARPDGVLPPGWEAVPQTDMIQGQYQLLTEAKSELDRASPNPALLGRGPQPPSGRAEQIRQAAGMQELQRVLGRFADWELRIYKAVWSRQRQFWKDAKWIRVTGEENAPKYIRINEPIPGTGIPQIDPQTGQQATDQTGQPMWQQPPKMKNHIAEMDMDIIIDTVPDTASLEQEVWSELMGLLKTNPTYAQQVPFELAIEMSPLPRKRDLIQKVEAAKAQQAQGQQAAQQAAENAAKMKLMSETAKTESETVLNYATAKNKQVTGIAAAITAHQTADQAEREAEQYAMGTPEAQAVMGGVAPQIAQPAMPPQPQPGQQP